MIDVAEIHPRGAMTKAGSSRWRRKFLRSKSSSTPSSSPIITRCRKSRTWRISSGDSLGLSQQAAKTNADVIVFCGVHFMAETAKILNPKKIVVLPDKDAGCSLEESCPADKLAALQKTNPNFWTVTYINCSAAVKALSDVICTSGNAVKIVEAAPKDRDLLFVPDENLGAWVMEQTGRQMTCGTAIVMRTWSSGATRCCDCARNSPTRKWSSIPKVCAKCATWPTRFARRRR